MPNHVDLSGYVLVMDVEKLELLEEDPIITIVQSSRPLQYPGAVRSMIFAPSPADLLIWAEHGGRICIADLRSQLMSRQTIVLDPKDPHLDQSSLANSRTRLNDPSLPDDGPDRENLDRITRELGGPNFPNVPPLTHDEQNILRFLRTAREREPNLPDASTPPAQSTPRTVIHPSGTRPRSTTPSYARAVAPNTQSPPNPVRSTPASERAAHRRSLGLLDVTADDTVRTSAEVYQGLAPAHRRVIHDFDEEELPDLIPETTSRVVIPAGTSSRDSSNRHLLSLVEGERAQARRRNQPIRQTQEPTDESLTSLGYSVRAREQVRALVQRAEDPNVDYESRGGVLANLRRRQFEVLRDEPRHSSAVNSMTVTHYNDPMPRGMTMPPESERGVGTAGLSMSPDGRSL